MRSYFSVAWAPKAAAIDAHQLVQPALDQFLCRRAESAHRADQRRPRGNHAHRAGIAGLHRAQADDRGVDRAHVAADDRLRRGDHVPGDQHRVDRRVRMRAVAAAPVDGDLDPVGGGHRRTRREADAPGCQRRPVVQRENDLGREAFEQPVVDHRLGAGVAFLAGLEDQERRAVEVPRLVQVARGGEQHRRVAVVAAAVHPAVVAGTVLELVVLVHRQRVHVGAQAHAAPGAVPAPAHHRDDAGPADPRMVLDAQRAQPLAHQLRRPVLLESELGMPVQVAAERRVFVLPAADVLDGATARYGHGWAFQESASATAAAPDAKATIAPTCGPIGVITGTSVLRDACPVRQSRDDAGIRNAASTRSARARAVSDASGRRASRTDRRRLRPRH